MQSTSLIKTWSTPEKVEVRGTPPGPGVEASETARAAVLKQDVRVVTPMYKTDSLTVSNGELRPGLSIHREAKMETRSMLHDPDYKIQREQEHYKLQIIDPKVEPHGHVPAHSHTLPSFARKRNKTPDFPSAHSKRSFTKLDPLEQRRTRVKSVEVKPITPHDYLAESLDRHRNMSMSPLQDKLRVNERDVNQPWDKPPHPGPRPDEIRPKIEPPPLPVKKELEDLAELADRRERLLDRARQRSAVNVHELRKVEADVPPVPVREWPKSQSQSNLASWKFSGAGFSPRSVVSINGGQDLGDQLRIRTDLSPRPVILKSHAGVQTQVDQQPQWVLVPLSGTPQSTMTREFKEEKKSTREVERYSSLNDLNEGHGTLIKIHDETARRPKSIMKSHKDKQLVVKENWDTSEHTREGGHEIVRHVAPKVTETVSTVEETKRTEEVERRVRESKDKKKSSKKKSGSSSGHHRESRHHRSSSSSHNWGPRPGDADYPPWTAPFGESPNAMWRQHAITANGHGGSQKYANGHGQHVSESYHRSGGSSHQQNGHRKDRERNRVHKSQSSREVYHNDLPEDYEGSRGGGRGGPIIEYPPTLPRDANGHPVKVHHRNGHHHGDRDGYSDASLHKTRSYDWDGEQRGKDTAMMRKWEADMTGLERDFRDSLLMPMPPPGQNVNQRERREEEIPGGHESFSRDVHAHSGYKPGSNTRYSEAKQDVSFKREQTSDRRL